MPRMIYYFFSYLSVSFILALLIVPLTRPLAFKLGAVDRGTGRRVHKGIVPRLGGIGIYLAFVIPMTFFLTRGIWDALHDRIVVILIASTVVLLIGIYDDIKGARIRNKLFAEIFAAAVIYAWGIRITDISNPFGGHINLGWLSLPITVLWIIIITNAINLIDGLDGLAAGTGIFIAATFFSLSGSDSHLQLTYVILAGSLLGFLRYNFPPASVFMGDSGSLFLGFFLAATSILSAYKATAVVTLMIPIIAFSLPLMDMLYAVLRRYYRGVPLSEPDKEHIHHKLLAKGFSKRTVVLVLYAINIIITVLLLFFVRHQLNIDFIGLVLVAGIAVLGLRMLGYIKIAPMIREIFRNYDIGRKRKYFHYVVRRFRRGASASKSLEDLSLHLTALMREYNFHSFEIHLDMPSVSNPVFTFTSGDETDIPIRLSFPIVSGRENRLGDIFISERMDHDNFLFTAEMLAAVSEEVGRLAKTYK